MSQCKIAEAKHTKPKNIELFLGKRKLASKKKVSAKKSNKNEKISNEGKKAKYEEIAENKGNPGRSTIGENEEGDGTLQVDEVVKQICYEDELQAAVSSCAQFWSKRLFAIATVLKFAQFWSKRRLTIATVLNFAQFWSKRLTIATVSNFA